MTPIPYLSQPFLKIAGQNAPDDLIADIINIFVEESLHQPGEFTLTLNNDIFPGTGEPWRHEQRFAIGQSIQIGFSSATTQAREFTNGQSEENLFQGEITSIECQFTQNSEATLVIRGYDISHRLYRGRYNRSFQNMSDTDIVKKVIGELGINHGTLDASGSPHAYIFQENQNNMKFLRERATRNGFELFVQDGKLNFRKPKAGQTLNLKWLRDIHDFHVKISSSAQVNSVEVRGWDYHKKRAMVGTANKPHVITKTDHKDAKKSASNVASQGESSPMLIVDKPISSPQEADTIAQALCNEIGGELVRAEAKAEGNPSIRAGKVVQLTDVGQYSGQYYITEARHLYENGHYSSEFSVRGLRGDDPSNSLAPDTGLEPGQTVLVGVVSNNQDPEGWGRVRVKFPTLTEDHESNWARVVALGAGPHRGWDCLPEINDEVLVAFEHGDIHRPYLLGGVWNGQDPPPEAIDKSVEKGKVRLRTFQTRLGHKLQFVEEDKLSSKKGIYLETEPGSQHKLHLNDSDKKAELRSSGGHSLLLQDQDGQRLQAQSTAGHTLTLDDTGAQKIDLTSVGDMNLKTGSSGTSRSLTIQAGEIRARGTRKITLEVGPSRIELSPTGIKITSPTVQAAGLQGVTLQSPAKIDLQSLGLLNLQAGGVLSGKAGGVLNFQSGGAASIVSGAAFQVTAGAAVSLTSAGVFQATGGVTAALIAPIIQLKGIPIFG